MGTYLNPGNGRFRDSLDSEIYVDKTGLITFTNRKVSTELKYVCFTRPSGFGKTVTADMLAAYYGHGCDSRALFDGLAASQGDGYEKHINGYDTIRIDVSFFIDKKRSVRRGIRKMESEVTDEIKREYPEVPFKKGSLVSALEAVYGETKRRFVFVLDEWDAPMRLRLRDKKGQREYLRYLTGLFKGREYVALAYMTGILPVKKLGTQGGPNMFTEFTMTDADPVREFVGFTEGEVKTLCEKYGKPYGDMKKLCGGYLVNGISVFRPGSAVRETLSERYEGVPFFKKYKDLVTAVRKNAFGVRDALEELLAGKPAKVRCGTFQNDATSFKSRDDVITLLVHLGALTYVGASKEVTVPNGETRDLLEGLVHSGGR